jgi:thiol-disulfide isomerase/thioredoxin
MGILPVRLLSLSGADMPRVRAPELPQNLPWLNCDRPLSLKSLKGRVVLLHFWTYGCINCLHMLPTLQAIAKQYRDSLTIISIHSSKFDNERQPESIRRAILRYDIEHPVLVDSDFEVWQQYAVRAYPTLVFIDPSGYVVDSIAGEVDRLRLDAAIHKLIQVHTEQGNLNLADFQLTLEKHRQPLTTPLAFPGKVLAAPDNRLFIADSGHHRLIVANFDGTVQHTIGDGNPGWVDGDFATARFAAPQGMALGRSPHILYVADTENHAIRCIDFAQQTVTTIAGTGQQSRILQPLSGIGLETDLNSPWDLVRVGDRLFIAMAGSHQIWKMDLLHGTIRTYSGTGAEFCVDGAIDQAAFAQPSGITSDGTTLFIADSETSTIRSLSLNGEAIAQTICGSGDLYGFGDMDGIGSQVRLQHCLGVAYDGANQQLWIADTYNHKIKRVNLQTTACTTVLGDGQPGSQDSSPVTRFSEPAGLSIVGTDLFVADTNNHAIRRIDLQTFNVMTLNFPGLCAPNLCFPVLPG